MRSTFVEKILNAPAGSMVYIEPDIVLSHDNSARVRKIFEKSGGQALVNPERLFIVLDRKMTGTTDELIRDYNSIRDFMKEQEVEHFFDCDRGICHQVVADYLRGGNIIVGSDSHTCTAGAFNCFAVGVNKTETAYLWKKGKMWFRVPETVKITLTGRLREGVYAKDLALWIMGMLREENVDYKALEYHGEGVSRLTLADRMTLANVSAEMGVKNSVFPPDDVLADYFGDYAVKGIWADSEATYYKEFVINLEDVLPVVMLVHEHHEVKSGEECKDLEVQEGLIGACACGRIEDLRIVARILKGRRIHPGFRLSVVPASYAIYLQARKEGLVDIITKAGAVLSGASCGPCLGCSDKVQTGTKRFISTTNSNSMRRMSEAGIEKYIASPATVAMTAIAGKITTEKDYSGEPYPYWGNPVETLHVDECDNRKTGNVWNYSHVHYISCKQMFADKLTCKISSDDPEALLPYLMNGLDSTFASRVEKGDIILAGEGFGAGHLIKHAAIGLAEAGIKAVIVRSANRHFYRLALNCGLPVLIAPDVVKAYQKGDRIGIDWENRRVLVGDKTFALPYVHPEILRLLQGKGLA
ncbi:MAG: aconitase family protein [Odoribacter sp.]|nr:aconitase family protein [Odoribacter sp.]MDE6877707.1 3-isopropylmalate dehydratase large subunit [Odoribacter sp.]